MKCTSRDDEVIQTLGRYGILSTGQVAKMFFSKVPKTLVRRRLRVLEKWNLIYRVNGLDSGGVAWALTKKMAEKIGCLYPARLFSRISLNHDVALSEVRYVLESIGLGENWVPEHVLKTRAFKNKSAYETEKPFVPDAIFSVRQKEETKVIALELELNGKNSKRYENIFSRYLRKKTLWAVWYLVPTEALGKKLEAVWRKLHGTKRSDLFMWSLLPNLLSDPLNTRIRNAHFSYLLRELFHTKQPDLRGDLPEIKKKAAPPSPALGAVL